MSQRNNTLIVGVVFVVLVAAFIGLSTLRDDKTSKQVEPAQNRQVELDECLSRAEAKYKKDSGSAGDPDEPDEPVPEHIKSAIEETYANDKEQCRSFYNR